MNNTLTNKPLRVEATSTGHAILTFPANQLGILRDLFDLHHIRYWIEPTFISLNGGQPEAMVVFYRGTDIATIQGLLDSIHLEQGEPAMSVAG